MPPEPPKGKLKRKTSRREIEEYRFDGGHAREIEQKRNNGQISCAECRRLKIKCDKQIPCQSCQRRGCAALCPNGSLSTGQGTRFVLAATEHLHRRVAKMSERIRQLEDALSELQAQHSSEPHPLLREDLLSVNHKDDDSFIPPDESGPASHHSPPEALDAFGTLSITDHGISRFFGLTGGSESDNVAQQDGTDSSTPDSAGRSETPPLPQNIRMFSQAFPFTPMGPATAVREMIEGQLPNWGRASFLTQMYCDQAGWLFHGVTKEQIEDELLPEYYSNRPLRVADDSNSAHGLALLFLVFAIGALVDLSQNPGNAEAEHYHQIARAAICLQSVLEKPSLVTIQALHMFSIYNAMSGNELSAKETSMETTWSLISLAVHLSQTIGLHRDSVRWGLSDKDVERRRILFWNLFVADAWHSLNTGRPPGLSLAYVDCRFPSSGNSGDKGETKSHDPFESWNYRFATECVAEVASRTLTPELPNYLAIMELDRKVREFQIPDQAAQVAASAAAPMPTIPTDDLPIPESMGRYVMSNAREVILLYLHRSFFAQAIIQNPDNPLKSQYAPSFLASYRASSTILQTIRAQYTLYPQLCARFWPIWDYGFSAAIVFGTIVTRGPRSPVASNAIKELDEACVLFTKAAGLSRRAAKALPILTKLSEKAHNALVASQNDKLPTGGQLLGQQWSVSEDGGGDETDELAIFAGRTLFVSTKRLPKPTPPPPPPQAPVPVPEGGLSSSSFPVPAPAPSSVPQLFRPEGSTGTSSSSSSSSVTTVDRWLHTERDPQSYPVRPPAAEYAHVMPQWRPPRRSHYSYGPQQHHPPPSSSSSSPSYAWTPQHHHHPTLSSPGMSDQFSPAGYSAQSHGYPHSGHHPASHGHGHGHGHPQTYERPSGPPPPPTNAFPHPPPPSSSSSASSQPQPQPSQPPPQTQAQPVQPAGPGAGAAPPELTELGLVSQESRLDERWTSFMRDSGYFDGFGYRNR